MLPPPPFYSLDDKGRVNDFYGSNLPQRLHVSPSHHRLLFLSTISGKLRRNREVGFEG